MAEPGRQFDPQRAALFAANYREAVRAAGRLAASLERTAHLIPLTGPRLLALDEDGLERLDAFRVRFADLQDLLAGKLFRGLLLLEEEQPQSQLDVLNAMEKRGVIPSFADWKALRTMRNAFMHDYPENESERAEALNLAVQGAADLLAVLDRVRVHATTRIGLADAELPPR